MTHDINPSNVTPITKLSPSILLQEVLKLMETWRSTRKANSERIPDEFWDKIFILLETLSESVVLSTLRISPKRLQTQREKRQRLKKSPITSVNKEETVSTNPTNVDFCEVKPTYPLEYKPAKAFSTSTCVVELYRRDGMLMKIHICTDKFEDLLRAFFSGDTTC